MTWCLTAGGKRFDMQSPSKEQICIKDIANALSKLCRFNGHCSPFYSVAQHSVLVSHLVEDEHKLAALLHDATEAYIGDMVSPLKALIPSFKLYEDNLWNIIADKFGLSRSLHHSIKAADLVMLATEKRDLMPDHPDPWDCLHGISPSSDVIQALSPEVAEQVFLRRFFELTEQ